MIPGTEWLGLPVKRPSETARHAAISRQQQLTKPAGALGRLEELAIRLAALQDSAAPSVERISIVVFAADHGVAAEGVSAFPQSVTGEMLRNVARGGAAVSVLARTLGAHVEIIDVGTARDPGALTGVTAHRLGPGTANFTREPAMTPDQLSHALAIGRAAAQRAKERGANLFIGGEVGIGNTTAATAIACALLNRSAGDLAGPGTGLDARGIARKTAVIQRALAQHEGRLASALAVLQHVGGFEIAALAGSYIGCAQLGLPALVDGFVATSAALAAAHLHSGSKEWLLYSHASAEPGHRLILAALDAQPLLDLGMRLGEGSGSAAAAPLLQMACALHNRMATFEDAGVSRQNEC